MIIFELKRNKFKISVEKLIIRRIKIINRSKIKMVRDYLLKLFRYMSQSD